MSAGGANVATPGAAKSAAAAAAANADKRRMSVHSLWALTNQRTMEMEDDLTKGTTEEGWRRGSRSPPPRDLLCSHALLRSAKPVKAFEAKDLCAEQEELCARA